MMMMMMHMSTQNLPSRVVTPEWPLASAPRPTIGAGAT
jgi:hypothetical protein